jgi:Asp-tRNA(Asn)/Glu-tRNA(Gln) amidotransferase A subunit family amidase
MTHPRFFCQPGALVAALSLCASACRSPDARDTGAADAAPATAAVTAAAGTVASTAIDRDLLDVTVPRLQQLYADKRYTVTQVVQWHLDRIDRYNGVYGAIETVLKDDAQFEAARLDAEATPVSKRGPLWGVPIVIKANTSVQGQVTTAGWAGFTRAGYELFAPKDATIVARLRAAGAIIVGLANMPDLANSDTNRSSSFGRSGNAYDVRFSPGGSSGGIVTAVATNMAVLGNGTDTGNSIRMPVATSALVGVFPTRGLVSIAGIAPLDWLLDNTGPIARTVTDAAIALAVMAGSDSLDAPTLRAPDSVRTASATARITNAVSVGSLKGKRFGVPAFVMAGSGVPFHGIPAGVAEAKADSIRTAADMLLRPETRAMFLKAVDALRAAGAEVVINDGILPTRFAKMASRVSTYAYMKDGTDRFLAAYGPTTYHSAADYARVVGAPLYTSSIGTEDNFRNMPGARLEQRVIDTDADAERNYLAPRRAMMAEYVATLDRLKLDGYVYPAIQMPPPDESMPQDGRVSEGPHSATSWVNMIGVPAVVVSAGYYASGLPFGLEFSARPWSDHELIAVAAAWERATPPRKPPTLVESGLLKVTPARAGKRTRGVVEARNE